MDLLDDILGTLGLRGVLYFRTEFRPPWSVTVPDLPGAARFHLVVQGSCHVRTASGGALALGPGDLVLLPRGRSHVLEDSPGRPAPPLETVLHDAGYRGEGVLVAGGSAEGASTQMVCGHLSFRPGADHPLLSALPDHLHITAAERARRPWLDEVLRLVGRRVMAGDPGAAASAIRMSEIVLIEILRAGIGDTPVDAFSDPQIGRALTLMHEAPEKTWTVESLAAAIGMSRTRFAERFAQRLGMGPIGYLSEWRLQKALALLSDSRLSVQEVAHRTGYASPAAFTRAFGSRFGTAPAEYRRQSA